MLPAGADPGAHRSVGPDQDLHPSLGDQSDLPGLPVAGVAKDNLGLFDHAVLGEMLKGGVEHRLEMPGVRRVGRDVRREDDP